MSDVRKDMPAFPVNAAGVITEGMTLRDYFATRAMQALIDCRADKIYYSEIAKWAYTMADAMLAAREGK